MIVWKVGSGHASVVQVLHKMIHSRISFQGEGDRNLDSKINHSTPCDLALSYVHLNLVYSMQYSFTMILVSNVCILSTINRTGERFFS